MASRGFVKRFLGNAHGVIEELEKQSESVEKAADILFGAWLKDIPVYILGDENSVLTASSFAAELTISTSGFAEKRAVRSLSFWDNTPYKFIPCWLKAHYRDGGIGIGISVKNCNREILEGMKYIQKHGGKSIGFSSFDNLLATTTDVSMFIPITSEDLDAPLTKTFHALLFNLIIIRLRQMIKET